MIPYNFKNKLAQGEYYETWIDAHFADRYHITKATREEQRQGIDRHYKAYSSGLKFSVEYKTDLTAARTHNAFIEIVSVSTTGKPGWAYTATAKFLFYFVPGPNEDVVRCLTFEALREVLPGWLARCPSRVIPNEGYNTIGLLVPIEDIEHLAVYSASVAPLATLDPQSFLKGE